MPKLTVATWNMLGGNGNWTFVRQLLKVADIVCLQECGDGVIMNPVFVPQSPDNDLSMGVWDESLVTHLRYGQINELPGNVRCSTAVILKGVAKKMSYYVIKPPAGLPESRRVLGVQTPNGACAFSIHAPASGDAYPYAYHELTSIRTSFAKFICAGDYNYQAGDFNPPSQCAVIPPSANTHAAGKIDYMVVRGAQSAKCIKVDPGGGSDHRPVIFEAVI